MKHQISKKLFFSLLTFVVAGNLFAQTTTTRGKEFFVSWGNNLKDDRAVRLELKIAAFEASTVTLHFTDQTVSDVTFDVAEGTTYSYVLSSLEKAAVYLPYSTTPTVFSKSLYITSTGLISAYALNQASATTDATNLLPVSNWGTDYYHISYPVAGVGNSFHGPQADGYALIAAQDETEIYQAGNPTPIATLDEGEVYYVCFPSTDVTGTHITSNKPIAYYVTNTGVFAPQNYNSADCLFQSLPPVNQWGTRFLVPCTKQGKGRVRVLASQNGTNITQSGATGPILSDGAFSTGSKNTLYNLQAGEFVELEMGATGCYISANKPVGVCAYMIAQNYVSSTAIPSTAKGDPSITWVAPIEQNMREILIAPFFPAGTTALTEHYALIVTPTAYKDETTVAIGGAAPSSLNGVTWIDNMACGYSFCSYQMTQNNIGYLFDNPKGLTVLGYGIGQYETYYYMSGSASRDLTMNYTINDISYDEFDNGAYCDDQRFRMRIVSELSTAPGHAIWTLNSSTIDDHQDDLEWDTVLPYGKHSLELLVVNKEGVAVPYGVLFTAAPSSVTWMPENNTGSETDKQNWNDARNWIPSILPASCTDVHIPGNKLHYPVLTNLIPPECGNIYFEQGGEVLRTDLLSYKKAFVDLTVQANRWYLFSPPLHNMYSGDFYRTTPNPFAASEQQTTYTMLYNTNNPEDGEFYEATWTGVFNTPDRPLLPGSGIAVWVDKHGTDYIDHSEISFAFPKNDVAHYLYNPLRPADANISSPPMPTSRLQSGRFIYEDGNGQIAADGNVTLQDMASQTSGSILVGNPFMAHLDFNEFFKSNATALDGENQYKMASGVDEGNDGAINSIYSYSYVGDGQKYLTNNPYYSDGKGPGLIPPMQAFIIDVSENESVRANISHTVTSVEKIDTFRSVPSVSQSSDRLLHILAGRGTAVSKALILQGAAYSTNYLPSEDSYKLFVSGMTLDPETTLDVLKPVQIYTRSSDGYALDINLIGVSEQDITVPLGIRTSEKGAITLNFSGMNSFGEGTGIYLYDAQYPERLINLSEQPEYVFDKTEDALYLENRLSLIIGALKNPLGLKEVFDASAARILSQPHRTLRIVSENGRALSDIRITDSWGRALVNIPIVSSSIYEYQTPTPGIYIVHIGTAVKKVVSIR
jgi:hypothetical protein